MDNACNGVLMSIYLPYLPYLFPALLLAQLPFANVFMKKFESFSFVASRSSVVESARWRNLYVSPSKAA